MRGTNARHYADWRGGDVNPIKGYLSTAVTEKKATDFYNKTKKANKSPLMLEIRVPARTKSIYIGDNTAYPKSEDELLLGRGLKYMVIERTNDIINKMILEVVP